MECRKDGMTVPTHTRYQKDGTKFGVTHTRYRKDGYKFGPTHMRLKYALRPRAVASDGIKVRHRALIIIIS